MTASDDNTAASIPGVIRDPITATNLLRVNSDGSINVTNGGGGGIVSSVTAGNGINASTNPIVATGTLSAAVLQPQGRLTLVTATPVLTSDQTAKGTVFYDSYIGNSVPVYNGTVTQPIAIGADEISLALNTTDNTSANLYDIFAFSSSGTLTLGTGPAWTNSTTRSAAISLKNGIWTNTASIALRAGGALLATVAANQATYLGTIYCTANGQTGMAFKPAGATGGSNNILGLYNAYNRVRVVARCKDSTASWTYNSATWQAANASALNRISWIDGLRQSSISAIYAATGQNGTSNGNAPNIGIDLDSISATPDSDQITNGGFPASTPYAEVFGFTAKDIFMPQIGFHFVQAMEAATNGGTSTFYGAIHMALSAELDM